MATEGDSWISEAVEALDRYEAQAKGADPDRAKAIVEGMQPAVFAKLSQSPLKTSPAWVAAATRYNTLRQACLKIIQEGVLTLSSLEQTNLNRIKNNLASWTEEFASLSERELQNAAEQDRWIRNVNSLNGLFEGIQNKRHPEVHAALVSFKAFVDRVNAAIIAARKGLADSSAKYADAGKRVEEMLEIYGDSSALRLPAAREEIEAWCARALAQRDYLPKAQALLADIVANAPDGKKYEVNERYYRVEMPGRVQGRIALARQQFDFRLQKMKEAVDWADATDPANESHVSNRLTPDAVAESLEEMKALAREAELLKAFAARLAPETLSTLEGLAGELSRAMADFARKGEAAVASVRMPEDLGDSGLADIAGRIIPERGFGPVERLVINYGLHRKDSTATVVEGEWLVTYKTAWEEFQAVSAEAAEGGYALFYNDFTKNVQGTPGTELGRWMLSGRFQGQRILKENIGE